MTLDPHRRLDLFFYVREITISEVQWRLRDLALRYARDEQARTRARSCSAAL